MLKRIVQRLKSIETALKPHRYAIAAIGFPLLAYAIIALGALDIYIFSPAGSRQQLMGVGLLMFGISALASCCAILLGTLALWLERPRYWGLFGIVLGFTPFVGLSPYHMGAYLISLAVHAKGLSID